jgi:hypothetical protein
MLMRDSLLNGITLARVTSERSDASPGPCFLSGFASAIGRIGLGSRVRTQMVCRLRPSFYRERADARRCPAFFIK